MTSIFDLDEIILALVVQTAQLRGETNYSFDNENFGMKKLTEYYTRYPAFQKVLSNPATLQKLSQCLKVAYRNPRRAEVININSFLDLVIAHKYYSRYGAEPCVNQAVALSYAIKSGDDQLVEKYAVILYKGGDYPNKQPTPWHEAGEKVIELAIIQDASPYVIELLTKLYSHVTTVYVAAKLRRKDLISKYVDVAIADIKFSEMEFVLNAVEGGDWEIIKWFPRWKYYLVHYEYLRVILYRAARGNSQDVITIILDYFSRREKYNDEFVDGNHEVHNYVSMLNGYLESGNYDKVVSVSEKISETPNEILVGEADFPPDLDVRFWITMSLLKSDCLKCLKYVEDKWGPLSMFHTISKKFSTDRLTAVQWELMNREVMDGGNGVLWRYVFKILLGTDDFDGLVRITKKFNPKLLFAEQLILGVQNDFAGYDYHNECYLKWLQIKLKKFQLHQFS